MTTTTTTIEADIDDRAGEARDRLRSMLAARLAQPSEDDAGPE
jgi:hypothetical protein